MLHQFISSSIFCSVLLILYFIHITADNDVTPLWNSCSNNETDNTNFPSDREELLSLLKTGANNPDGFFMTSVNTGTSNPLFGLVMCYLDVSLQLSGLLNIRCTYLVPKIQFMPNQGICRGPYRFQNSITLNSTVHTLLQILKAEAIQSISRNAYGKIQDQGNGTKLMFGIVQCTRDLSASDCGVCIQSAIARMDSCIKTENGSYRLGFRILSVGCYIRYYDYQPPLLLTALNNSDRSAIWPYVLPTPGGRGSRWLRTVVGVSAACVAVIIILVAYIWLWRRKKNGVSDDEASTTPFEDAEALATVKCYSEFKVFELDILRLGTNDFSDQNKLGQGGFGSVYKGSLDGQNVAIKRLSACSSQGLAELKNEVKLLAKVKHRNLVQLVGCCIEEKEKLLCYELLPNGSLDKYLFANDSIRREILDWKTRYSIIQGISSGLYYLHEKSTVRIVHRDLKASNILLDIDMTPKISDFGLARLFEEDRTHLETSKLAGTLGYIAPELLLGSYSTKSDVYSFGVLLLEIVTGKRIFTFSNSDQASSLISYVHQHAVEGDIEELKDPVLEDVSTEEFTKCIHIGLLCVQEDPTKRPSMKAVEILLSGYSTTLPEPPIPLR